MVGSPPACPLPLILPRAPGLLLGCPCILEGAKRCSPKDHSPKDLLLGALGHINLDYQSPFVLLWMVSPHIQRGGTCRLVSPPSIGSPASLNNSEVGVDSTLSEICLAALSSALSAGFGSPRPAPVCSREPSQYSSLVQHLLFYVPNVGPKYELKVKSDPQER